MYVCIYIYIYIHTCRICPYSSNQANIVAMHTLCVCVCKYVCAFARCLYEEPWVHRNVHRYIRTYIHIILQTTYSLALSCGIVQQLNDVELFALIVSALCHDLEPPGVNNLFVSMRHVYIYACMHTYLYRSIHHVPPACVHPGHVWSHNVHPGHVWSHNVHPGHVWSHNVHPGHVWSHNDTVFFTIHT